MFDSNYNANSILPIHHHQTNNNNNNIPFDDHLLNNFPSHLLDDEFFLDTILPYHHHHPPPPPPPPQPPQQPPQRVISKEHKKVVRKAAGKKQDGGGGGGGGSSKRKAGKKDRHSKIYTAHGPRDRRMRLSLQIARKFFDLQDMLGFDKASKTIEWLFNKSRAAIKDLSEKSCTNIMSPLQDFDGDDDSSNKKEKFMMSNKGGMICEVNEKRKQARARARERTKEKLMKNQKECSNNLEFEENPNNKNNNTLDDVIRVDKVHQLEDQMASVGIIENFLASSSSSSSIMPNFNHHGAHHLINRGFSMEFPGNRASENGTGDVGLMQQLVEYTNHVQGLNCAFMDRSYNQGF